MNLTGLKGLRGLDGLSATELQTWRNDNASKIANASDGYIDRLYRNQQFIKKFGLDTFHRFNADQRDAIFKHQIINDTFMQNFSPFTGKKDKAGNWIVDKNKGMGDRATYENAYQTLDDEGKLELLNSNYLTQEDQKKQVDRLKQGYKVYEETFDHNNLLYAYPDEIGDENFFKKVKAKQEGEERISNYLKDQITNNDNILKDIRNKSLKRTETKLKKEEDQYKTGLSNLNDTQINNIFMKLITPDEKDPDNPGNNYFKSYFHDGKNIEDEVKDFSIDDKRDYIARYNVLKQNVGSGLATELMTNYAQDYIADHQSFTTTMGLFGKDVALSALTYTADKWNSLIQDYHYITGERANVYMDNFGNVVPKNKVFKGKDGVSYYKDDDGKVQKVKLQNLSLTNLDNLGKDADGNDKHWLLNNRFLSDVEQYGTTDEDQIKQYRKLGVSPHKVAYKVGDEYHPIYESLKMMSFTIGDIATNFIPIGMGMLGNTLKNVGEGASVLSKISRGVGRTLALGEKVGNAANATVSALAIGNAYGRGVYTESFFNNLNALQNDVQAKAESDFTNNYNNDKNYKQKIDVTVNNLFNSYKEDRDAALKQAQKEGKQISLPTDEVLLQNAKEEVRKNEISNNIDKLTSNDKYYDAVAAASESANHGAMIASITDAAKYVLVNNFGFRNYLFKNSAERTANYARKLKDQITEENSRLHFKSLIDGHKLKTLGKIAASQAWGGAWTNYTDELQSWGGKRISQDEFANYLNGVYDGNAKATTYGAINAAMSYLNGAEYASGLASSLNAGLVGAIGSLASGFINIGGIARQFATDGGRAEFKKMTTAEKWSTFLTNGILSEYAMKRGGERQLRDNIDLLNNVLDKYKDFEVLNKVLALNLANINATNQTDKDVIDFLQAINSIGILKSYQNDDTVKEYHGNWLKRTFEKAKDKFGDILNGDDADQQLRAIAQSSSILSSKLAEIEMLANGTLDEDTAKEYLSQYYAQNPSVSQSEENNAKALQTLQENAKALLDAKGLVDEVDEKINQIEKERGEPINTLVRHKIRDLYATNHILEQKRAELEKLITGRAEVDKSVLVNPVNSMTKVAIEREKKAIDISKEVISSKIDKINEQADKKKEEFENFKKEHEITEGTPEELAKLSDEDRIIYNQYTLEIHQLDQQQKFAQSIADNLTNREDMLNYNDPNESEPLTEEEILNDLNPTERAKMLDDKNFNNYNSKQQKIIKSLKEKLQAKDPNILKSIQEAGRIDEHLNGVNSLLSRLYNNPNSAVLDMQAQRASKEAIASEVTILAAATSVNNFLRKLKQSNVDLSDSTMSELIFKNLRELNPIFLERLADDKNVNNLRELRNHKTEIAKALEWSHMMTDISKAMDSMKLDAKEQEIFTKNIDALIGGATSRDEAMAILNSVVESSATSQADKTKFKKLLDLVDEINNVKKSTTVESKEDKTKRQDKQISKIERDKARIEKAKKRAFKQKQREVKNYIINRLKTFIKQYKKGLFNSTLASYDIVTNNKTKSVKNNTIFIVGYTGKKIPIQLSQKEAKRATEILNRYTSKEKINALMHTLFMEVANRVLNEFKNNKFNSVKDFEDYTYLASQYDIQSPFKFTLNSKSKSTEYQSTAHKEVDKQGNTVITFSSEVTSKKNDAESQDENKHKTLEDGKGFIILDAEDIDHVANAKTIFRDYDSSDKNLKLFAIEQSKAEFNARIKNLNGSNNYSVKKIVVTSDGKAFAYFNNGTYRVPLKSHMLSKYTQGLNIDTSNSNAQSTTTKTEQKESNTTNSSPALSTTSKEDSNDNNTQSALEVSEQENSNDNNSKPAIRVTDEEQSNDEQAEQQKNLAKQGETVDGILDDENNSDAQFDKNFDDAPEPQDPNNYETPSLEQQAEQAEQEGVTLISTGKPGENKQDNQDGNQSSLSNYLQGFYFRRFNLDDLINDGVEKVDYGKPGGLIERVMTWFDNEGIKIQEILDNEVGDIAKLKPKVHLLYVNPKSNATNDDVFNDTIMLAIEYTNDIANIHKKERGGVITANEGKQYLIIGTLGFDGKNRVQKDSYIPLQNKVGKPARFKYFNENPSERFFVLPNVYTEIADMTSGRIVKQTEGDSEVKMRSVLDLLNDPKRNPEGLKLEDLKWGIMFATDGLRCVNVSPRNTVFPPNDQTGTLGATFLLIKAANGNYIPAAIESRFIDEIKPGKLLTRINDLVNQLTSVNYEDRLKAVKELSYYLHMEKDKNFILIGDKNNNTVTFTKDNVELKSFHLNSSNFNRNEFIESLFKDLRPRINISLDTLMTPSELEMYGEARALDTDIAKLGTSGSSFSVYLIDSEGKPIKTQPLPINTTGTQTSGLEKLEKKRNHTVIINGTKYREVNGKWFSSITNKEITNESILNQIKWMNYIRSNELHADLVADSKNGHKNNEYYVIDSNPDSPTVIIVRMNNTEVIELDKENSLAMIDYINKEKLKKEQAEAAKKANQEVNSNNKQPLRKNTESTNQQIEEGNKPLTSSQILEQNEGNFAGDGSDINKEPTMTEKQQRAQSIVDQINADTNNIVLDEITGVYVDLNTAKEFARVTSVISAVNGVVRFDPNSPWALPSTNIGTGFDIFVRDYFANKLGNLDNLQERYPNATTEQLLKFKEQLDKLKENFDKRGLTVVPYDVTVTGEVIIEKDGKQYKLPVAGTLDLLAYDKDGNFHIFDMKTNRSAPNAKKEAKWNRQLYLYKTFLEQKYGIRVVETSIIPIKVNYKTPKGAEGFDNATTVYSNKGNQVYTTDNGVTTEVRDTNPNLMNNIPIETTPIKIEHDLLTDKERSLLEPLTKEGFDPNTGVKKADRVIKPSSINDTGSTSLASLQATHNQAPTTAAGILKRAEYRNEILSVIKEKGFTSKKPSEVIQWLKDHNMPINDIDDINSWIDMLKNCR